MVELMDISWQNYSTHLKDMLFTMMTSSSTTDVTLVCGDQTSFKAHKIVLSSCSRLFHRMINNNSFSGNTIIYLHGINNRDMNSIMQYIYLGKTSIPHDRISDFLETAKNLEIKDVESLELPSNKSKNLEEPLPQTNPPRVDPPDLEEIMQQSVASAISLNTSTPNPTLVIDEDDEEKTVATDLQKTTPNKNTHHTCRECGKAFLTEKNLFAHQKSVHNGVKFYCKECDFKTSQILILERHVNTSHKEKKNKCNFCENRYQHFVDLKKHLKVSHNKQVGDNRNK